MKSKLLTTFMAAGLTILGWSQAGASIIGYTLNINNPVFNSTSGNENVPDFRLTNNSTAALITNFNVTIGDTNFFYDFIRTPNTPIDPLGDLVAFLNRPEFINNQIGTDDVDYGFTGFDPNDVFQFEVDVDPVGGGTASDFRVVLFPTAVVTVNFSDGRILSQTLNPPNTSASGFTFTQQAIPEPGALAIFGLGLVGLAFMRRRRRTA